jgi:hypothetical protein
LQALLLVLSSGGGWPDFPEYVDGENWNVAIFKIIPARR